MPRRIALLAILPAFLAVSCAGPTDKSASARPNVILYVIDGAAADRMSVYGYDRRTTPNLERLAAEGVVFENAYSNSSDHEDVRALVHDLAPQQRPRRRSQSANRPAPRRRRSPWPSGCARPDTRPRS